YSRYVSFATICYYAVYNIYFFYYLFILLFFFIFFFFNDTATTEIYTLSLHDALPISGRCRSTARPTRYSSCRARPGSGGNKSARSEEHTSELQSPYDLVCRLLLEKKKKKKKKKKIKKNNKNQKTIDKIKILSRHMLTS